MILPDKLEFVKNISAAKSAYIFLENSWKRMQRYALYLSDRDKYNEAVRLMKCEKAYGKKSVIDYVPNALTIYITFKCNFRCDGCTYLLKDESSFDKGGFMPFEDFEKVLRMYAGKTKYLMLSGGEATLHPRFVDMAKLGHELGYNLSVATNGSNLLNVKEALSLFKLINVSMDSYDYSTFNKNRGASQKVYKKILEGLAWMIGEGIPFRMSYVLSNSRLSEAEKFIEFAKTQGPAHIMFLNMIPHSAESDEVLKLENKKVKEFYKRMLSLNNLPFDVTLPTPAPENKSKFESAVCSKLWNVIYVHENGDIAYCCQIKADSSLGNVFNGYDPNSSRMVKFREDMITGAYPKEDCAWCHRRFDNIEPRASYKTKLNKWTNVPGYLSDFVNIDN